MLLYYERVAVKSIIRGKVSKISTIVQSPSDISFSGVYHSREIITNACDVHLSSHAFVVTVRIVAHTKLIVTGTISQEVFIR